ncbi:uncharacterized protein LOC127869743 [Dreissena polymorpha]|uniref:uncharacterized protein LOC127869743 n=1 Tax=Dreissena polymorpha TaxID=45954 RepID=UPI0022643352|nr:uncharacterized protein LOC127869743 [Dreissena polymorpha]
MRGKKELIFTCCACKEDEMEDSGAAQQPEQMEGVAHSTMIDASEELPPLPSITFNLEFSLGTSTSTDTTAADTTGAEPDDNYDNTENTNTENEPDNASAYFDLSRDGPTHVQVIVENPLPDAPLTDTIIEDGEISCPGQNVLAPGSQATTNFHPWYEVVEEGTERRKKKLVSSDGNTYVKKQKPTART